MHTFIAECDGERVCARYPDNEEATQLEQDVQALYLQESSSLDLAIIEQTHQRLEQDDDPKDIVKDLMSHHPTSYVVPYFLGNTFQNSGLYLYSIDFFACAFSKAPHDALRFQAKHREALSWKLFADGCAAQTRIHTAFSLPSSLAHAQRTLHSYELTCLTLDKAREYTSTALPAEATTYEFNTASYYLAVAQHNYDTHIARTENTEEKQKYANTVFIPLRVSRAFKELSNQLAQYYTITELEEEYEKFDQETERLEASL